MASIAHTRPAVVAVCVSLAVAATLRGKADRYQRHLNAKLSDGFSPIVTGPGASRWTVNPVRASANGAGPGFDRRYQTATNGQGTDVACQGKGPFCGMSEGLEEFSNLLGVTGGINRLNIFNLQQNGNLEAIDAIDPLGNQFRPQTRVSGSSGISGFSSSQLHTIECRTVQSVRYLQCNPGASNCYNNSPALCQQIGRTTGSSLNGQDAEISEISDDGWPQCIKDCLQYKIVAASKEDGTELSCSMKSLLARQTLRSTCTGDCSVMVTNKLEQIADRSFCHMEREQSTTSGTSQQCITEAEAGKRATACVFPFIFDGMEYHTCTTTGDAHGKAWCSTKVNSMGEHIGNKGHWGHCNMERGHCNRITPTPTSTPTPIPAIIPTSTPTPMLAPVLTKAAASGKVQAKTEAPICYSTDIEQVTHEFCQARCDLFVRWSIGCSYGAPPRQTSAAGARIKMPNVIDDTVGATNPLNSWFQTLDLGTQLEAATTTQSGSTRTPGATSGSSLWGDFGNRRLRR